MSIAARAAAVALPLALVTCATMPDAPHAPDAALFYDASVDGNCDIWLQTPTGGARRLTTSSAVDNRPVPSPEGSWLAFQSQRNGSYDVFVMPLSGRGPARCLTPDPAHDGLPVWSPDGRELAFFSSRGLAAPPRGQLHGHIYVVARDGTALRRLTSEPLTSTVGPMDWSPDGRFLLLSRRNARTGLDIYQYDLENKTESVLCEAAEAEYGAQYDSTGNRIAYYVESDQRCDVAVLDLRSGQRRILTSESEPGWHYVQGWTPDDGWLAILTYSPDFKSSHTWALRLSDGRRVGLETPEGARNLVWSAREPDPATK